MCRLHIAQFFQSDFTIFCPFAFYAVHFQKGVNDFPVYIHVFGDKNMHTGKFRIIFFLICAVFIQTHNFRNLFKEGRTEKRFAYKSIYACFFGIVFYLTPVIGRNEDNGKVFSCNLADFFCKFKPGNVWHFPVQNYEVVQLFFFLFFNDFFKCCLSGFCKFRFGSQGCEGVKGSFKKNIVIINDKNFKRRKGHLFFALVACPDIEAYCKAGSFSFCTLTFNCAFHQVYHLFCNGQTQTCSLNGIYAAVCLTGKG